MAQVSSKLAVPKFRRKIQLMDGVGRLFIGNPDGMRQKKCERHHNQHQSGWEFGRDFAYLTYNAKAASTRSYDFQRAGNLKKVEGRAAGNRKSNGGSGASGIPSVAVLRHRDVVGSVNVHPLAFGTEITFPAHLTCQRADPVRVLARLFIPRQVQCSPPVVGAQTRATMRA